MSYSLPSCAASSAGRICIFCADWVASPQITFLPSARVSSTSKAVRAESSLTCGPEIRGQRRRHRQRRDGGRVAGTGRHQLHR